MRMPAALERRMQRCWDEGRDPADDASVQAWLLAHPESLESFAGWRARVGGVVHARLARRRAHALRCAAGVLAAAAAALVLLPLAHGETEAPRGAVLSSTFEVERAAPPLVVSWRERRVLVATPQTWFAVSEQRSAMR